MNKIFVTRSFLPSLEEYTEEIKEIWESHWLTNMGPKHEKLREQLKEYLKVPYMDLFTNGHMALEMSLQALDLHGEVITTPFTFVSTTHAITRNGLTPVFCDINEEDYTMDVDQIEQLITEKTCAIMPVHVYGNVCDVERIEEIAKKHNLKVIYDAAHAFGVTYKGRGICEYGDISCMSFHATKVFHSIEGGCACFGSEDLGKNLYYIKNFGIQDQEHVPGIGANAKMNEFCAAMGICNLRHNEEVIQKRRLLTERYRERLMEVPGLKLNKSQKDVESNYAYFPLVIDQQVYGLNRDQVVEALKEENIFARKYFYPAVNEMECYAYLEAGEKTPVAAKISRSVICLPLYPELSQEDVDRICDTLIRLKK
ncbi:MAG: DegT/DnrJ/EryC1/StrS family aminotransferase [Dorea sp.]|nr:DegT/DnrJ/EryC1/StrS family aminotransferase [Dorea sp.]